MKTAISTFIHKGSHDLPTPHLNRQAYESSFQSRYFTILADKNKKRCIIIHLFLFFRINLSISELS